MTDAVATDVAELSKNESEILALIEELDAVEEFFRGTMNETIDDLKEVLNDLNDNNEETVTETILRPVIKNDTDKVINFKIDDMFNTLVQNND
ncbi:hypothetical protein D3C75_1175360 [compost metagenome]